MDDTEKFFETLGLDAEGLSLQLTSLSSLLSLILAAIMGLMIVLVYLRTAGKESRDRNLFMVIPVLTILMAVIMRIEGAQVLLFFGIFGILSIVRFRSDITDQKGITFILFGVIEGVLIGVNNHLLATLTFLVVTGIIFVARFAFSSRIHFRVIIKTPEQPLEAKDLVEDWLEENRLAYRYIGFQSEQGLSKLGAWDIKTRLEWEVNLREEGDLMVRWIEFLPRLLEKKIEGEVKPGTSD